MERPVKPELGGKGELDGEAARLGERRDDARGAGHRIDRDRDGSSRVQIVTSAGHCESGRDTESRQSNGLPVRLYQRATQLPNSVAMCPQGGREGNITSRLHSGA